MAEIKPSFSAVSKTARKKRSLMALPKGMVCRASITVNGVKLYAKDYGKKAFCWFPNGDKKKNASDKAS